MFYLYRHIRPDKNQVFYIGRGKIVESEDYEIRYRRAFVKMNRNNCWQNIVKLNRNYEVEIMLESDDYIFIKGKEKEFIDLYGREDLGTGTLCNLISGSKRRLLNGFHTRSRVKKSRPQFVTSNGKIKKIKRITKGQEIIYNSVNEASLNTGFKVQSIRNWCTKYCRPQNEDVWYYI